MRLSRGDLIATVATVAIGAFFFWGSFQIDQREGVLGGPRVFPQAASVLMILFGLAIPIEALVRRNLPGDDDRPSLLVVALIAGGLAYVWLIGALGFLLATLIVAPFAFAAFGVAGWVRALLCGLGAAIAIYGIFFGALGIYDPPGRHLDFREILEGAG